MQRRAPNKRGAYRSPREMQPYLGDVPDGLEPIRQPYQTHTDEPRWLETWTGAIIGIVAAALFGALLLAAIILALMFAAQPVPAQSQQIKIPTACVKLAALFGATVPNYFSRIEAEAVLAHMNVRMILVPEARHCRAAIQKELKK